jgi:hypothetical protein
VSVGLLEAADVAQVTRPIRSRAEWGVFGVTAALGLLGLGCLVWGIAQAFVRPPDYAEGCLLFNASRIRAGLPLYVDPVLGAHEYGEPPARYFVAYTPLAATWLAALPTKHALVVGRLVGLAAWYAALLRTVITARPGCRWAAATGALFAGSLFLFTLGSASVKPDSIALLLASIALTRALDSGRADARSGLLFGIAALVKQSAIGMAVGALGGSVLLGRERRWRGALAAGVIVVAVLAGLELLSGGLAFGHMHAALGLAFDPSSLAKNVASRAPFIAGLVAMATAAAFQARGDSLGARLGLAVLGSSTLTACIGFGKVGAASNYLMEPALASVVILSRFPLSLPRTRTGRVVLGAAIAVTLPWATNATFHSLLDEAATFGEHRAALQRIRQRCLDRPAAVLLSADPGVEMAINGRIHTHAIELWNQARLGRFPAGLWAADVRHPNVRCVITWTGDAQPPSAPSGYFPEEVAEAMRESFTLRFVESGYAVYTQRER